MKHPPKCGGFSKDGMPTKVVRIPFLKKDSHFFGYFLVTSNGYPLNIMGTKKKVGVGLYGQ